MPAWRRRVHVIDAQTVPTGSTAAPLYTACSSAFDTAISMSCALSWLSGCASMRASSSAGEGGVLEGVSRVWGSQASTADAVTDGLVPRRCRLTLQQTNSPAAALPSHPPVMNSMSSRGVDSCGGGATTTLGCGAGGGGEAHQQREALVHEGSLNTRGRCLAVLATPMPPHQRPHLPAPTARPPLRCTTKSLPP